VRTEWELITIFSGVHLFVWSVVILQLITRAQTRVWWLIATSLGIPSGSRRDQHGCPFYNVKDSWNVNVFWCATLITAPGVKSGHGKIFFAHKNPITLRTSSRDQVTASSPLHINRRVTHNNPTEGVVAARLCDFILFIQLVFVNQIFTRTNYEPSATYSKLESIVSHGSFPAKEGLEHTV
jgi:hypothetical protein